MHILFPRRVRQSFETVFLLGSILDDDDDDDVDVVAWSVDHSWLLAAGTR